MQILKSYTKNLCITIDEVKCQYTSTRKNSSGTELISSIILNSISKTVLNTSLFFLAVSP